MKKFDFYTIRPLIKAYPDAYYYVVFGERSNGKTYSSLDYALERNAKTGEQFAYIRRWGEDIRKKNLTTLFDGHVQDNRITEHYNHQWNQIYYGSGKFWLENKTEDEITRSDTPVGFAFDLNSMEHYKSNSFPNITTVIFDEFLSRNGYLPNEWILFMNTLSTIIRHRNNVKIFMLGNTVNKYCPYFYEMGLNHIREQKPGTIDVYHYGTSDLSVVCERTQDSSKKGGKASDVYFAFENPELKMITGGDWEIAIYPHLEESYRPKDVINNFFIIFEEEMLHGEIVCSNKGLYIFIHRKTTPIKKENEDIVYTTRADTRWNFKMCLTKQTDKLSLLIMRCLRENRIFYSTNEVGEVFRNYVMWSDTFSIKN